MKRLLAFFRRTSAGASQKKDAVPPETAPEPPKPAKRPRFQGGFSENTQDLLGIHDGGRAGFRRPIQG